MSKEAHFLRAIYESKEAEKGGREAMSTPVVEAHEGCPESRVAPDRACPALGRVQDVRVAEASHKDYACNPAIPRPPLPSSIFYHILGKNVGIFNSK